MKTRIFIAILLFTSAAMFGGASISDFKAHSQNGSIVVSWQSNNETNVKQYVIERQTVNGSFLEVGRINSKGDGYYEFVDQSAYKANGVLYIYRIKIVDTDGSETTSWSVSVAHNVSGIKRTWGSIKALFR